MKLKKTIYKLTLAIAELCMLASCAQPNGGDKPNPKPETPVVPIEQTKLATAKENLDIGLTVAKDTDKINLPAEYDGVAITWASSDDKVIKADGTVLHNNEQNATVTLTATLEIRDENQKEYKDIKEFTVTVYGTAVELTPEQVLNAAASKLVYYPIFASNKLQDTYTLVKTVTADGKNVNVTWGEVPQNQNISATSDSITFTQDFVVYDLNLNATLEYDNKTKEETIVVKVPAITVFNEGQDRVKFKNNEMTCISGDEGIIIKYTVNSENRTLDYEEYKQKNEITDGAWKTRTEIVKLVTQFQIDMANAAKKFESENNSANFKAFISAKNVNPSKSLTEEELNYKILEAIGEKLNPPIKVDENAASGTKLTQEQQTKIASTSDADKLKAMVAYEYSFKTTIFGQANLDLDVENSWDVFIAYSTAEIEKQIPLFNKGKVNYKIGMNNIDLTSVYDPATCWAYQYGRFKNTTGDIVSTNGYTIVKINNEQLQCEFDADFGSFKTKPDADGKVRKGTVKVDNTGNMTVNFDSKEYVLKFIPGRVL